MCCDTKLNSLFSQSAYLCDLFYFVCKFRSLSFLVKLEQLDLGSNELEVLVNQQLSFNPNIQ